MIKKASYLPGPYNLYYEIITPDKKIFNQTIIMIHGGAHTGACYMSTPDGRDGWAPYFAKKGFEVVVMDWPGIGRSGYVDIEKIDGEFIATAICELIKKIDKEVIIFTHSISGGFGWKIGELMGNKITHIVAIAPGPMGNIQEIPKGVIKNKNVQAKLGPYDYNFDLDKSFYFPDLDTFISKKFVTKDNILFPSDFMNVYKASLIALPPKILFERLNINGSQLKIIKNENFKNTAILILTGTHDPDHPKQLDKQIEDYFINHGVDTTFCYLGDCGINNNGHMLMLEKNNLEIADKIIEWINLKS